MVLDFEVKSLRDDVVRVLRPAAGKERARTAYDLYVRASQLDEDPGHDGRGRGALPPGASSSIRGSPSPTRTSATSASAGRRGRRREALPTALEIDARQPEAQYNLGYVMLERGKAVDAIPYFLGRDRKPTPASPTRTSTSRWPTSRHRRRRQGAPVLEALPRARAHRHLGRHRPQAPLVLGGARVQRCSPARVGDGARLGRLARHRVECGADRPSPRRRPPLPCTARSRRPKGRRRGSCRRSGDRADACRTARRRATYACDSMARARRSTCQ